VVLISRDNTEPLDGNRPPPPAANRLLARLPTAVYRRLRSGLTPVRFEPGQVLHEAQKPARYAYFPGTGVLSAVAMAGTRQGIEVGTVGGEGVVGSTAFLGVRASPHRVVVQVAGDGLRADAAWLAGEAADDGPLRRVLLNYHSFFLFQVSQSVACNGLHSVARRCARWLLVTHDRVGRAAEFRMTHAYLSTMLGVRRASVSLVLNALQADGLVRYHRGAIAVRARRRLEAAACPCYRIVRDEYDRLLG
jgi:CRP-like cAMP-binding protein